MSKILCVFHASCADGADVGVIAKRMAKEFNEIASDKLYVYHTQYQGTTWVGSGHEHAAGFDAPLGWEGE